MHSTYFAGRGNGTVFFSWCFAYYSTPPPYERVTHAYEKLECLCSASHTFFFPCHVHSRLCVYIYSNGSIVQSSLVFLFSFLFPSSPSVVAVSQPGEKFAVAAEFWRRLNKRMPICVLVDFAAYGWKDNRTRRKKLQPQPVKIQIRLFQWMGWFE